MITRFTAVVKDGCLKPIQSLVALEEGQLADVFLVYVHGEASLRKAEGASTGEQYLAMDDARPVGDGIFSTELPRAEAKQLYHELRMASEQLRQLRKQAHNVYSSRD